LKSRFKKVITPLDGLYRIERKPIVDQRGFLSRIHCESEFSQMGLDHQPSQINYTFTNGKGSVRGLHFQLPPHCESKFVSCLNGEIWDVVVDLRRDSTTFLHWHAEILSSENQTSLYVPKGCAHGFQTISECCQLLYLHSDSYVPNKEGGINPMDPKLGIKWPLPVKALSERDKKHPMIENDFRGLEV